MSVRMGDSICIAPYCLVCMKLIRATSQESQWHITTWVKHTTCFHRKSTKTLDYQGSSAHTLYSLMLYSPYLWSSIVLHQLCAAGTECPPAGPLPVYKRSTTWRILHIYNHICSIYIYIYMYIQRLSWKIKILIWMKASSRDISNLKAVVSAIDCWKCSLTSWNPRPCIVVIEIRLHLVILWPQLFASWWVKLLLHDSNQFLSFVAPMCFHDFNICSSYVLFIFLSLRHSWHRRCRCSLGKWTK